MTVQIKFESNQNYQTEAIEAVTELFKGLQRGSLGQFTGTSHQLVDEQNSLFKDLIFANRIPGSIEFVELVQRNVRYVQDRTRNISGDEYVPIVPDGMRNKFDSGEFPMDYSIEMETGTGKTYVYLRTTIELYL